MKRINFFELKYFLKKSGASSKRQNREYSANIVMHCRGVLPKRFMEDVSYGFPGQTTKL